MAKEPSGGEDGEEDDKGDEGRARVMGTDGTAMWTVRTTGTHYSMSPLGCHINNVTTTDTGTSTTYQIQ